VRRIYREENLTIRLKTPKRRRAASVREERVVPIASNQSWAMDFMHDVLADGSKIRFLTIVDTFSRESLALEVAMGFKSAQVVEVLRRVVDKRGTPERIHCDNGPEFVSLQLDQWAYWNRVKLDFSRPGRPSDKRVLRIVQQPRATGTAQPELVPIARRRTRSGFGLAPRLQRQSPAQFARKSFTRRVRPSSEEHASNRRHFWRGRSKTGRPPFRLSDNLRDGRMTGP